MLTVEKELTYGLTSCYIFKAEPVLYGMTDVFGSVVSFLSLS